VSIADWVDDVADEFERAWRGIRPPRIADFLDGIDGERRVALQAELEQIDHAYRDLAFRAGQAGMPTPTGTALPPAPADQPGISGYEILGELGRGGMGVVYRARQRRPKRVVALKMIRDGGGTRPMGLNRFRAEAEAAARLQHPHIVQIYEVGDRDGRPYYSMEFVEGGSLDKKTAKAPLPARQAAELLEVLARAVHYAHQHGVVHRDLKPANVLLALDGTPKISDFGLAKCLGEGAAGSAVACRTQSGDVLGTPSYMAPEQAAGQSRRIGPLVDVYALGAILYEALTGRPPFQGDSLMDVLLQVRSHEPVPPKRLQPRVPRDLETICIKAMAKVPARRYTSAADLADDVRRFLNGEPIRARPSGPVQRAGRWCRRHPAGAGLAALTVVGLLAGTGVVAFLVAQQKGLQEQQRMTDRNAYVSDMRLARPYWEAGRLDWLVGLLERHRPKNTGGHDQRGFEWNYWNHLCQSSLSPFRAHAAAVAGLAYNHDGWLVTAAMDGSVNAWDAAGPRTSFWLTGHAGTVTRVAWNAGGCQMASSGKDGSVKLWDFGDGRLLCTLAEQGPNVNDVAFSPDGQWLASAGVDLVVRGWLVNGGLGRHILTGHTGEIHAVSFSPNGQWLASAGSDHLVGLWAAPVGPLKHFFTGHTNGLNAIAFSPDSRLLASASHDRTVKIWDATNARLLHTLAGHSQPAIAVAFSPDGRLVASGGIDHTVRLWHATTGLPYRCLKGHTDNVLRLAFSPDGQCLASADRAGEVRVWKLSGEQESRSLRGHASEVYAVAFRPDGRLMASAGGEEAKPGEILLWNPSEARSIRTLSGHDHCVNGVAFNPDGTRLASASDDHTVRIWEVAEGRLVRVLEGHTEKVWTATFSPDGRRLASAGEDSQLIVWDTTSGEVSWA
jgi:WD40 repeat protein